MIYVRGNAGTMDAGVRRASMDVFRQRTSGSQAEADAWLAGLPGGAPGYLEEIWAGSGAPSGGTAHGRFRRYRGTGRSGPPGRQPATGVRE